MPELPEVETVRVALADRLTGLQITDGVLYRPNLRFPFPQDFMQKLIGSRVLGVFRWAKYLLISLDSGTYWIIHLGMSGQCRLTQQDEPTGLHDHVCVDFTKDVRMHYHDPRRFGMMDICENPARYKAFSNIGREAIFTSGTFSQARARGHMNAQYLIDKMSNKKCSIKQALLDQRVVAGLGNIYVNEALWDVGIDPRSVGMEIPTQLLDALVVAITDTLSRAISSGGSSLRDFVHVDGALGYFQHQWRVYSQQGQACSKELCPGKIEQCVQQGRSSFFCQEHQTLFQKEL